MSKDPAFLFYTADFLTETMLLTDEQTGKYIRLLCLQHQRGHLAERELLKVCGSRDDDIFALFKADGEGRYYNESLENEIVRRRRYASSRSKNRASSSSCKTEECKTGEDDMSNICGSYDRHMETVTVTVTEADTGTESKKGTVSKARRFVPPTREEVAAYCAERGSGVNPQRFVDFYASKGWMVGKSPMRDWRAAVRNWDAGAAERVSAPPPIVYNLGEVM